MDKRLVKISRTLSYALRHHPESFGLTLDEEGWVSTQALLLALDAQNPWQNVSRQDIDAIIAQSDKQRFEVQDEMIRAHYGHSIPQKMVREPAIPPAILFHGTTPEAAELIRVEGLKPMQRQYVHLSAEKTTAKAVALRRTRHPVILRIDAVQASQQGIQFYASNDMVWLADTIPPECIAIPPRK